MGLLFGIMHLQLRMPGLLWHHTHTASCCLSCSCQACNCNALLLCDFMQVLQADGGTRCACINAAALALADAGIPMKVCKYHCLHGI
jgi:hypothetical protein